MDDREEACRLLLSRVASRMRAGESEERLLRRTLLRCLPADLLRLSILASRLLILDYYKKDYKGRRGEILAAVSTAPPL